MDRRLNLFKSKESLMLLNSRCKEFLKNLFSAYGLHERVATAQNVKTNGGLGMFTVNNSEFLIQSKISCCWVCKRESTYHLIQKI